MEFTIEKLPKSEVRINATISPDEITQQLEDAAHRLSEHGNFPGFRPGKAPYDIVKAKLGEMAIWNEAIEGIVRHAYAKAIIENKLEPLGSPAVDLKKFAPGNPIEFSATVSIIPAVLDLPKLEDIHVAAKDAAVEEKDIDTAIKELQRMQTREVAVDRPASKEDKVTMDIAIEKEHVAVEGGQAKNHSVYLSEQYYIPGFPEHIIGLKKGDTKTFSLEFPEKHFQKHLAGQQADFTVTITEVAELQPPTIDDTFAKTVGQESLEALRTLLKNNLSGEAKEKEEQRQEQEALEMLVEKSRFEEIPEKLINNEVEKMVHELEHSLGEQGMEFSKYLGDIKKTRDELKLDFTSNALKRVKTILVIRALAARENILVDEAAVAKEIEMTMNQYKDDAETQKQVRSEEYATTVRNVIRNRKTLEYLREKTVK